METSAQTYLDNKAKEAEAPREWKLEPLRHLTYFLLGVGGWIVFAALFFKGGLPALPLAVLWKGGLLNGFFVWLLLNFTRK